MPWVRKRRAALAAFVQTLLRQDRNGERREFLPRRQRIRGENCGDRGVWLAQDLLCVHLLRAKFVAGGQVVSIAVIVTPSRPIWFHAPLGGTELGDRGLPFRTGGSGLGELRSALYLIEEHLVLVPRPTAHSCAGPSALQTFIEFSAPMRKR